jgi:hypothetical protein
VGQAIDDHQIALNAKLVEFDKERAQIDNPAAQKYLTVD